MNIKKAMVTGASRGIGRGIALCLAREGYDVAISYVNKKDQAEELAAEINEKYGRKCYFFQAALEQPGAGVKLFNECLEALGGVDLLVNNAGVTLFEHILDLKEETLDFLFQLDFKNYLLMLREAARYMAKNHIRGSIINITSSRGDQAYPDDTVYGAFKAGLRRAVEAAALDLAPYGIRVNNVAPGAIRIRSREEIAAEGPDSPMHGLSVSFWDDLGRQIPLGRSGLPEDIGEAVVYLASDKASYITGITLRVDGGLILPGMPEGSGGTGGWGGKKHPQYD